MNKTIDKTRIIERDPRRPNRDKETHRFGDREEYDKITGDPRHLWVKHEILETFQHSLRNKQNRDTYEDFVYGFMYHFDHHSSPERWDVEKNGVHKIYFRWTKEEKKVKKEAKYEDEDFTNVDIIIKSVEIYIDPRPIVPFDSTIVNSAVDPERPPAPPPPPANP